MEKSKNIKQVVLFQLLLNGTVVVFITLASYIHIPLTGLKDVGVYLFHLFLLQLTVSGFLYLLSLQRWMFKVIFPFLFLSLSSFSFWVYTQDISVTMPLIQSVLETKPDIAIDLITAPFLLYLSFSVVALFFIFRQYKKINPLAGFKRLLLPALACIFLFSMIENKRYGTLKNRLPYNVFYGLLAYYQQPKLQLNHKTPPISYVNDSLTVVFVLGETVRADHLSINGYKRNTTPNLFFHQKQIISFKNLFTSNSYTGASVPQILTNKRLNDTINQFISVFSVANNAEFKTIWIGNQTLEKSFYPIVKTNQQTVLIDKYKSVFSFNKKLDEEMLPVLDSVLNTSSRQLITVHMIGSHWWYENRYSSEFKKYTPVIASKHIPSLSSTQIINSYDNTIVYLDYFLDEIIQRLEERKSPSVLFYVSDHGEFLGENGKWLHAQAGEATSNPAYIIWFSKKYIEKYPDKISLLKTIKNNQLTTDVIFYELLNILDITYHIE